MVPALSGGDAFEIIVALKDLTEVGFAKVSGRLGLLEAESNGTKLTGFSKATLAAERSANRLAGKETKDGGGIGGVSAAMSALGGPATILAAGIAEVSVAGLALTKTYDDVEQQEKQLAIAAKDHGIFIGDLTTAIDNEQGSAEKAGFSLSDLRAAHIKLTEAGQSLGDQLTAMPQIMDLARAKNLSLAEAAKMYELALMGNARALKDLGVVLPKTTNAQAAEEKAQKGVTKASDNLQNAQDRLKTLEDQLGAKHHHTAADADRLAAAHHKVKQASDALKAAQDKLKTAVAAQGGSSKLSATLNEDLQKALGGQRNTTTSLQQAQTKLGNVWEHLSTAVGPGLEDLFTKLVLGLSTFLGWVSDFVVAAAPGFLAILGHIGDAFGVVFAAVGKVIDVLKTVIGLFGDAAKAIANSPIGAIASGGSNLVGGIGNAIGGFLSNLPHFASGGMVSRPTLALLGEGSEREYVIPESRLGSIGGAATHVHLYLDGHQIAEVVSRYQSRRADLVGTSSWVG